MKYKLELAMVVMLTFIVAAEAFLIYKSL